MRHRSVVDFGAKVAGTVIVDAPLAQFTTYRIGGPARVLVEPQHAGDVRATLDLARDCGMPWLVIGLGSNLLVSDTGFPGVVLRIGRALGQLSGDASSDVWRAGAGVPTPLLARRTARAGRAGIHRLVGVPGTVGGGVFMNAGAHGQEFKDTVQTVEVVTSTGEVETRAGTAIPWQYRSGGLRDVVILGATFAFGEEGADRLQAEVRELLRWRKAGTPFTEPCCGSVFRNPASPGGGREGRGSGGHGGEKMRTAGQLIDEAGMKGFAVGGAAVSRVHANYIVNRGGASARDVLTVIEAVRSRVRSTFGIELELEVQLVGEF